MLVRICNLIGRLGPLRAAGYLLTRVALQCGMPHARLSWSQFGEDLVIRDILGLQAGYYADIGCNDPEKWSNTFLFYLHGWRGLLVDANADLIARCRHRRPQDTSVCCLISDQEGTGEIEIYDEHALSSGRVEHNASRRSQATLLERRTVPTQTLTQLLAANNAPADLDLLTIDVEGMDMLVLRGLDFHRYRPKLIVVEDIDFDPISPDRSEVYQLLIGNGYRLCSSIHPSLFFLAPHVQSKSYHGGNP